MRKLIVPALLAFSSASAQKTELRLALNSGSLHYGGSGSTVGTDYIYSRSNDYGYASNPYGRIGGLAVGVSLDVQYVGRGRGILGASLGFEGVRSRVRIDRIHFFNGSSTTTVPQDGSRRVDLVTQSINFHPFAGYRIVNKKIRLDLTAGPEFGFALQQYERGRVSEGSNSGLNSYPPISASITRQKPNMDVRVRAGLSASFGRFGIYTAYSHGLTNFTNRQVGGNSEVYSRFLRFGAFFGFGK